MNPDTMPPQGQIISVGVTGASGALFAQKALTLLEDDARVARVHLVVTETGQRLFAEELGLTSGDLKLLPSRILGHATNKIEILPNKDVGDSMLDGHTGGDCEWHQRRFDCAVRRRHAQRGAQIGAVHSRHTIQSHSLGEYAASAAGGCSDHAGNSCV